MHPIQKFREQADSVQKEDMRNRILQKCLEKENIQCRNPEKQMLLNKTNKVDWLIGKLINRKKAEKGNITRELWTLQG